MLNSMAVACSFETARDDSDSKAQTEEHSEDLREKHQERKEKKEKEKDKEKEKEKVKESKLNKNTVGISMPTKDLKRWEQDGKYMQQLLQENGYSVDLQYASNDIATQVNQIENMISEGCKVIVIAPIEPDSLTSVLEQASKKKVYIISYDRLILNSDRVQYYVAFDRYMAGLKQGEYVRDMLELDSSNGPYYIEFFAGDPGDNNAKLYFIGAMDLLGPYIDAGILEVRSGMTDFESVATLYWDTGNAQSRMDAILATCYSDGEQLDAVVCSNDSIAMGVICSLEENYTGMRWPIITGQDCDINNVYRIIEGKQSMSIYMDTRVLVEQTVKMVDAIIEGDEVPVNDTTTYNNGMIDVKSFLCEPYYVDAYNYKEALVGSGYYPADYFE